MLSLLRILTRSLKILNTLFLELEKRIFDLEQIRVIGRPRIILIYDGQDIEIDMREVMKITWVKNENWKNLLMRKNMKG